MEDTKRIPIVGVVGSGSEAHAEKAEPLGEWLARSGVHLLTGGGGGVMESVSRAFHGVGERRGLVIGVLPGEVTGERYRPAAGYPNRWIEVPIFTHLPRRGTTGADALSRNHIVVLSSNVIVALPGSAGTASETILAARYGIPIVAFINSRDEIPGLAPGVPGESAFERIQAFVSSAVCAR